MPNAILSRGDRVVVTQNYLGRVKQIHGDFVESVPSAKGPFLVVKPDGAGEGVVHKARPSTVTRA